MTVLERPPVVVRRSGTRPWVCRAGSVTTHRVSEGHDTPAAEDPTTTVIWPLLL